MTLDQMHVVHVTSAHSWTDNRIHYREAQSLAEAGYRVTVIACEGGPGETNAGVEVIKLPRLPRGRRASLGAWRAIRAAHRTGAGLVHLHDPELVWGIPLLRAAGRVVIYDAHEDLPLQVQHKPYIGPILRPVAVLLALLIVRTASLSNHVVAATDAVARRFPAHKVTVVRNYPPLREEENAARPVLERPKNLAFVGAITPSRHMDVLVRALREPNFPYGWSLDVAGTAPPAYLKELSSMDGWKALNYRGQLPSGQARSLLLEARVGIILSAHKRAHLEALPTKMFEYFAAGIPVITSDFPLRREMLSTYECGLLVDPTDSAAVADAVSRYARDPGLLERHSRNARRAAVDIYNWSAQMPALLDAYKAALGSRR